MASDKDWELRHYRDGDEVGILECLTAAFGSWPAVDIDVPPLDHLRWKLSSGFRTEGLHFIVEADGRIVGTRLLIAQQWLVRGQVLNCTKFTDLSIDHEFRGRGIFPRLWRDHETAARTHFDMSVGFTDNRTVMDFMTAQGHRPPANTLEHLRRAVAAEPSSKRPPGFAIRREVKFDHRVEGLFAAAAKDFDLLTVRSVSYLNWRYADARAGRFAIFIAEVDDRFIGYAVVTVSRSKAFIADLLVLPGRDDVLNALIDEAVVYSVTNAASSLRAWCVRQHPYRDSLLGAGLGPVRDETSISFLQYGSTDLSFVFEDGQARLHIVPGDTDVV